MMLLRFFTFILIILLAACGGSSVVKKDNVSAKVNSSSSNNNKNHKIKKVAPEKVVHEYRIRVVGLDGNPIEGVSVRYGLKKNLISSKAAIKGIAKTDARGLMVVHINPEVRGRYEGVFSSISGNISKAGYFSGDNHFYDSILDQERRGTKSLDVRVELARPKDYIGKGYLKAHPEDKKLTKALIKLQEMGKDQRAAFQLEKHSTAITRYKGKRYLKFSLNGLKAFDTSKKTQYDIGRLLFDGAIRKALAPLEGNGVGSGLDGYNLQFAANARDFTDQYSPIHRLTYDFYLNRQAVARYRAQKITGQSLLDQSVILLDKERIQISLK